MAADFADHRVEQPEDESSIANSNYQKTAKNAGDDCGCEVKLDIPGMPSKTPAFYARHPTCQKK